MKVHGLGRAAAALAVLLMAAGAARANMVIYTEGFSGGAGSQPTGWTANTTSDAVSQNDGSSEYEQRRTASGGTERAFGSLSDTDVFHPGVWRDVTIEHNMRFSGGDQNNNGTVFRARNGGHSSGEYYHARIWGDTLQLYRVRGGSFSLLATDSSGPGIGSITNRLMRVSVENVPAATPDGNQNNDSDHVRINVQYFNGATDASPVARSINHVDTSSSAITRAGGVGFRSYFGGSGSSGNRSVFNTLQVATNNRYLLWYDDYFDAAALRPEEAYTSGGMGGMGGGMGM